jgi:hypothetical protein
MKKITKKDARIRSATLYFPLPEDEWGFQAAIKGPNAQHAISEFSNWLRAEYKYNNSYGDLEMDLLEKIREKFWEHFKDVMVEE